MNKKTTKDFQDITNYEFIGDNVLIKAVDISSVKDGIYRGKKVEDKPIIGEVISCGKGRTLDSGGFAEMEIRKGDMVLFNQYMTIKYNISGEDYYTVRAEDVVAVLRGKKHAE